MKMKRFLAALGFLTALALPIHHAQAARNTTCTPTSGVFSGVAFSTIIGQAFTTINSSASGTGSPAVDCSAAAVQYETYFDSSSNPAKWSIWDGTLPVISGYVDTVNHLFIDIVGGGVNSLASATTTDLCSPTLGTGATINTVQAHINITGTTPITGFGSTCEAGQRKSVVFSSAGLVLTQSAGLLLPNNAGNITTNAGDTADIVFLGGGNSIMLWYTRANGQSLQAPAVVSVALCGTSGLIITNDGTTPNTSIDINADQAAMLNASNVPIFAAAPAVVINTLVNGANGQDSGARPTSGWDYFYLISNGSTTSGLASTSPTAPVMPGGYTFKCRVGAMFFDASANAKRFVQRGNYARYKVTPSTNTIAYPAAATGNTLGVITSVNLANFLPPTATAGDFSLFYTGVPATGAFVSIYSNANAASQVFQYIQDTTTSAQNKEFAVISALEVPQTIFWSAFDAGNAQSHSLFVTGWFDKGNLN